MQNNNHRYSPLYTAPFDQSAIADYYHNNHDSNYILFNLYNIFIIDDGWFYLRYIYHFHNHNCTCKFIIVSDFRWKHLHDLLPPNNFHFNIHFSVCATYDRSFSDYASKSTTKFK